MCHIIWKEVNQVSLRAGQTNKQTNKITHLINSHQQNQFPNERDPEASWWSHSESVFSQHGEYCGAFPQILVHLFSSYNKSDTGRLMMWNPETKWSYYPLSADKTIVMQCEKLEERGIESPMEIQCMMHLNQQGLQFTRQHTEVYGLV